MVRLEVLLGQVEWVKQSPGGPMSLYLWELAPPPSTRRPWTQRVRWWVYPAVVHWEACDRVQTQSVVATEQLLQVEARDRSVCSPGK